MDNRALFEAVQSAEKEKRKREEYIQNEEERRRIEQEQKEVKELYQWIEMIIKSHGLQKRMIENTYEFMHYYDFTNNTSFGKRINDALYHKVHMKVETYIQEINKILTEKYSDEYITYTCEYINEKRSGQGDLDHYTAFRVKWKFNKQ